MVARPSIRHPAVVWSPGTSPGLPGGPIYGMDSSKECWFRVIDFHAHAAHYDMVTESYAKLIRSQWGDRMESISQRYASPEVCLELVGVMPLYWE